MFVPLKVVLTILIISLVMNFNYVYRLLGIPVYYSDFVFKSRHISPNLPSLLKMFLIDNLNERKYIELRCLQVLYVVIYFSSLISTQITPRHDVHQSSLNDKPHIMLNMFSLHKDGLLVGTNTVHLYTDATCAWGPPCKSLKQWNKGRKPKFSVPSKGWDDED